MPHCARPERCILPDLRIGGTSFLVHDAYVPAIRAIAAYCDDISLLLFETGHADEYLITAKEIQEIARIGDGEGIRFQVHLPTDGHFGATDIERMENKILRAIERTLPLHPHTFVLHVETPEHHTHSQLPEDSTENIRRSLKRIAAHLPDPEQLALENLEGYPLNFWDIWLKGTSSSRCADIGHIWKDGGNPETFLDNGLDSTLNPIRVCHLHGVRPRDPKSGRIRDHVSLRYVDPVKVDAVLHLLLTRNFAGVVTLEVFDLEDFLSSYQIVKASHARYTQRD